MPDISAVSAVDVSAVTGLTAIVLLTLNLLLGLLVSTNYNSLKQWPHRKLPFPLFKIHNWTAYTAITVAVLHPAILLFSRTAGFHVGDLLWPLHSPGETLYNTLGAIGFYLFAMVVVTSYFRPKLGYRPWKKLHYFAYAAAAVLFLHGIFIDQNLKNEVPDFFDG